MRVGGKKYNKFISIFALILSVVFLFALLFGCSNVDEPPEYENPPEQSGPSEDDPPETDDPPEEDPPETDNPPVDNPPAEELPDDVYAVCDGVTAEYMGLPFESGEAYVHANRT